ncbi:hypothetical protein ACVWWR_000419 [Bradyrhizobium sp. LM3.2]
MPIRAFGIANRVRHNKSTAAVHTELLARTADVTYNCGQPRA